MNTIHVKTAKPYDILIERGSLTNIGQIIKPLTLAATVAVITDSNVAPLYLDKVVSAIEKANFKVVTYTFPAGERSKTMHTIADMLSFFVENKLTRKDLVIALGGGVCGDMVGFASAIYMRGIDFVQVPTSLLAQIDSSVGGKTGVDLPEGKNLVGAFHQPIFVLVDPDVLNTLPEKFMADGLGEAIKYGCIKDRDLFDKLQSEDIHAFLDKMIYRDIDIKRQVVENDEFESGERMLLNFGHTIGHAIEQFYHYEKYTHGQAVAIGMVMMTMASEYAGLTKKGTLATLLQQVKKFDLPTHDNVPLENLIHIIRTDKKSSADKISLVILEEIGKSKIYPLAFDKLLPFLKAGGIS